MAIFSNIYDILRAPVGAAWPECLTAGIFEAEDLETIPWDQLPVNYAAIVCSAADKVVASTAGIAFNIPVRFLFMGEIGTSAKRRALRQHLDDMLDYLDTHAVPNAQVVSYDGVAWGNQIEANRLLEGKSSQHRLVEFRCTVLVGYC